MEFAATGVQRCAVRRHRSTALWSVLPQEYGVADGAATGVRRYGERSLTCNSRESALWTAPPEVVLFALHVLNGAANHEGETLVVLSEEAPLISARRRQSPEKSRQFKSWCFFSLFSSFA